jgi:surface carbohydrate biosynthesis protein
MDIQARGTLLIPVENQVRELDPKLLLACIAARRGFACVVGPRRELHLRIASFPRSVYLSKSITTASLRVFRILRQLGHQIVAWDEEALVHPQPAVYYARRLCPQAIRYVSHLFAWGQENEELWRRYPQLPAATSIHITGNPRGDLLRPELRSFYEEAAACIRKTYGDFILINTNFNHVNGFVPVLNLFQPAGTLGGKPKPGRAAKGMPIDYAEGLRRHKQLIFEHFQRLIPNLDQAFPGYTTVVRPHPTENQNIYHAIAARCKQVRVINEGNVVPWIMASRALIHNGCTTGVEAYALGVPAVSYRAAVNDYYDDGFYRLPNSLSHQCFDFAQLQVTLRRILSGEIGVAGGDSGRAFFNRYVAALNGPLACERIVEVIETSAKDAADSPDPAWHQRLAGVFAATRRRIYKRVKAHLPGYSHNSPDFQRYRYPELSLAQVEARISRLPRIGGQDWDLRVECVQDQFFKISSPGAPHCGSFTATARGGKA